MGKVPTLVLGAGLLIIACIFTLKASEEMRLSDWSVSSEGNSLSLPVYPSAQAILKETRSAEWTSYSEMTVTFSTNDSPENVLNFYNDILLESKFNKVTTRDPGTAMFIKDPDTMADPLDPSLHLSVTIESQKNVGEQTDIKIRLTINYPRF
jgi:hypothetical protein